MAFAVVGDFAPFITDQIALNGFRVLAIELAHALRVHGLAAHHRDPFDRMLICQAIVGSAASAVQIAELMRR